MSLNFVISDNICEDMAHYYVLTACLTHSHDLDVKKVRMSNMTKNFVYNLLQQGIEMTEVVKICQNEQGQEQANRKCVTYLDVKYTLFKMGSDSAEVFILFSVLLFQKYPRRFHSEEAKFEATASRGKSFSRS